MLNVLNGKILIGKWNILIKASNDMVWEILSDSSNMAIWGKSMVKHTNAGKEHLGAIRECELDFAGKMGKVREETIAYDLGNEIFWSMQEDTLGMKKMMKEFIFGFRTVAINQHETNVQFEQYFIPRNFLTKLMIKVVMKPKMGKTNMVLLADLKKLVEQKAMKVYGL